MHLLHLLLRRMRRGALEEDSVLVGLAETTRPQLVALNPEHNHVVYIYVSIVSCSSPSLPQSHISSGSCILSSVVYGAGWMPLPRRWRRRQRSSSGRDDCVRGQIPTGQERERGGQCAGGHFSRSLFLYGEEGFKWNKCTLQKASGMWKTKPRKEGTCVEFGKPTSCPVISCFVRSGKNLLGSRSVHGTKNEQKEQRNRGKQKLGFGLALAFVLGGEKRQTRQTGEG